MVSKIFLFTLDSRAAFSSLMEIAPPPSESISQKARRSCTSVRSTASVCLENLMNSATDISSVAPNAAKASSMLWRPDWLIASANASRMSLSSLLFLCCSRNCNSSRGRSISPNNSWTDTFPL